MSVKKPVDPEWPDKQTCTVYRVRDEAGRPPPPAAWADPLASLRAAVSVSPGGLSELSPKAVFRGGEVSGWVAAWCCPPRLSSGRWRDVQPLGNQVEEELIFPHHLCLRLKCTKRSSWRREDKEKRKLCARSPAWVCPQPARRVSSWRREGHAGAWRRWPAGGGDGSLALGFPGKPSCLSESFK